MVSSLSSIDIRLVTYSYFFSSLDHAEKIKEYLSSKHHNMYFFLEEENDGHLSFLDICFCEKGKFLLERDLQ